MEEEEVVVVELPEEPTLPGEAEPDEVDATPEEVI